MKAAKIGIVLFGVLLISAAIAINPVFTIKPTEAYVEFVNLTFIKFYIIIIELVLFLVGWACLFKPGKVMVKISNLSIQNIYRRKAEISLMSISVLLALITLELFSRFFFASEHNLPFHYNREEMVYPALYTIEKNFTADGTNVLLLGGSVLHNAFDTLREEGAKADAAITFHNAAYIAHTSLDSLYKCDYLSKNGYTFDYIIFYHGINDVRLNNIPPEYFKKDYSHYFHYKLHSHIFDENWTVYDLVAVSTLGYNAYQLFYKVYSLTTFKKKSFIPYDIPASNLVKYGKTIKTEATFKRNLSGIIERSKASNAVLIVPLFATQKDFARTELTRIWGEPENVLKAVSTHNGAIRRLQPNFVLIETEVIGADKNYFEDICHFTPQGRLKFSKLILQKIHPVRKLEPKEKGQSG